MSRGNLHRASTSESYNEKKVFFRIGNTILYSITVIRQFYFSNKYVIQYLRCEISWSKIFLNIWYVSIERFVSSFCLWYIFLWWWSSCIDFLNFFDAELRWIFFLKSGKDVFCSSWHNGLPYMVFLEVCSLRRSRFWFWLAVKDGPSEKCVNGRRAFMSMLSNCNNVVSFIKNFSWLFGPRLVLERWVMKKIYPVR